MLGILGTGMRATAVARRLLETRPPAATITIFGRDLDRAADLERAGARRAASPADLAARSEVVLIVLNGLGEIDEEMRGPSGLQAGVHSPTTVVIGSAMPPGVARDLARRLPESTAGLLRVVDAPLTGRLESIAAGTLSIMVGAGPSAYLDLRPVLDLLGRSTRVGGVGAGQVAAACGQLVVAATSMALGEAAVLAERYGLDLEQVLRIWRNGEINSDLLRSGQSRLVAHLHDPSLPAGEALAWLQVAELEAARTGTRTDLGRNLRELYQELAGTDLGDADLSVTQSFVEQRPPLGVWRQPAQGEESDELDVVDEPEDPRSSEPGRRIAPRHVATPAARMLGSA
jgi:3-hydroxyisobutyrate dehydrogenase-like beta-hydroxyacid dehydrogenase